MRQQQRSIGLCTVLGRHRRLNLSPPSLARSVAIAHLRYGSGPVIGKGGVKINEIRTQSQCTIRVTDPGTPAVPGGPVSPHERLVVLQGAQMNINVAVQLLHQVSSSFLCTRSVSVSGIVILRE